VRIRFGFVVGAVAATFAALAPSAAPADQIRLAPARSAFPERVYVLSLPAGMRLGKSAVKVTENGHGVVDLSVAPIGASGRVASGTLLAIDASQSMRGAPIENALEAARSFAARRNANQRLAILTFNSSSRAGPFTVSQKAIERTLAHAPRLRFGTHLYSALAQGIQQVRAAQIDAGSIVVLSDGADVGSAVTLEQVVQSAKKAHVRLFTVGLRSKTFRPEPLKELAHATGGSFVRADSPGDLARIYDQLGYQLAHEYFVRYHSIERPGRTVNVSVSVTGAGKPATDEYDAPEILVPSAVFHRSAWDGVWQSVFTMIAVALLVPALVAVAIAVPLRHRGSTVRSRVSDYVSMPGHKRDLDALISRVFTGTERSLERTRWWQRFKDSLQFAGIPYPPVQVVFATVVVTLFVAWVLSLIAAPLMVCALAVPFVLRSIIKGRIARKRRSFGDQLADNLDVLASGLRAGHSLVGALAVVVADAPEPSKTEFQRVVADEQLGVPLDAALDRVVQRMRNRDLEQVALVAAVQSETGGNAAEVLDRVTDSIRERQELRRLIRTLTAQGRLARWIVSLLPIVLIIAIGLISPDYMHPMFTHSSGLMALFFGACLIVAGSVAIGKIVDIEV
jgi:tight adherence protein B